MSTGQTIPASFAFENKEPNNIENDINAKKNTSLKKNINQNEV